MMCKGRRKGGMRLNGYVEGGGRKGRVRLNALGDTCM